MPVPLPQMLEEWDPQEYQKHLDVVEPAIQHAVQDSLSETRTIGRAAFAAYAAGQPERATALLKRFDGSLQNKLRESAANYTQGAHLSAGMQQHTCPMFK